MIIMKFYKILALVLVVLISSACTTVLNTTTQDVVIKTTPENAKISINGKRFGNSPQTINIERGTNHNLKVELEGYEPYETQITRKISFYFWLNVFNGVLPGMLIDMFTGSMYNLLPEDINVELVQKKEEPKKSR